MYTIRLLCKSVISEHAIEACGSDSYLKVDGRIKRIDKIHQLAFDRVHRLKNLNKGYIGFNVYQNNKLIETNLFYGYHHLSYKAI